MLSLLFSILSLFIETVNCSFGALREARQQSASESTSVPSTFKVTGYDTPFCQDEVTQAVASFWSYEQRAFQAHPDRTFYLEFADGGKTQIQVSIGDEAPDELLTVIGVHGMGGDSDASYLHEVLSLLVKDNRARGVVFNLRGCGKSTATSPTFHHGGSTSDLGAVVAWVTMQWPKSKVYVVGTSLGAVIAGKILGLWGDDCPISAAALVSPVYDFPASCKAMETDLVSRTLFNPAVGTFYANLVKKNKDAFDVDHWSHTRPNPFPQAPASSPPSSSSHPTIDSELARESPPFAQEFRNSSFVTSSTRSTSLFSSLPSPGPSTPGTSAPPTPTRGSSFCFTPPQTRTHVVVEYTPEVKEALSKSLQTVTSRFLPQPLTKFCKSFVASTAHFLSGEDFMAETSAVDDLPNIRVPCLAVNCADDPLMPGKDLPRSEARGARRAARKSPFVAMAVGKKGGHLGTFKTKKWRRRYGNKRYFTAVVEGWFKANEALPQMHPHSRIITAHQGFETRETYRPRRYT